MNQDPLILEGSPKFPTPPYPHLGSGAGLIGLSSSLFEPNFPSWPREGAGVVVVRLTPQLSHAACLAGRLCCSLQRDKRRLKNVCGEQAGCGACSGGPGFSSLSEPGDKGRVDRHLIRVL